MNRSKRYALAIAALALSVGFHAARADDEALFGALRSKVAELRAHESGEVLARMKNAFPHITACPPDTPEPTWGSRASIGLNGVDYLYGNPPTSADETEYCFFLVKPLHRALTVEEARDFSDAMMMPDILHSVGGKPSASERNERSVLAERHFLEIRALVKSGTAKPFDQNTTKRVIHPVGNLRNLEDCSQTPIDELEMRSWEGNPGSNDNQGLYNDQYYWRDLDCADSWRTHSMDFSHDFIHLVV